MTMTRQDFEAVALVLRTAGARGSEFAAPQEVVAYIATRLAHMFAQDNRRFDTERFLKAAGVATTEPPQGG